MARPATHTDERYPARGKAEAPKTPAQMFALIAGGFLTALGVLSLIFTAHNFGGVSANPPDFIIWAATGWNAVFWIALGVWGLLSSARVDASRTYGLVGGAIFAFMAIWGWIDGNDVLGIFAADSADNITHSILAIAGPALALMPEHQQRKYGAQRPERETTMDTRAEDERFSRDPATRQEGRTRRTV